MVLVQNRAPCGANPGQLGRFLSSHCTLRSSDCVLRTRYATPIGIVDTSGGLAALVLPLTRYLVHRDSGDALRNLRVEVFH